jgi:hypothetical protein
VDFNDALETAWALLDYKLKAHNKQILTTNELIRRLRAQISSRSPKDPNQAMLHRRVINNWDELCEIWVPEPEPISREDFRDNVEKMNDIPKEYSAVLSTEEKLREYENRYGPLKDK